MGEQLPTRILLENVDLDDVANSGSGNVYAAADDASKVRSFGYTAYIRADVVARLVEAGERYRIASSAYGGASASMKYELIAALRDARQAMEPTNGKADE